MNLYVLRHTVDETELYKLEKKCLFNVVCDENYFMIEDYIDTQRSPFVKFCIKDIEIRDSLEELVEYIRCNNIAHDNFKVKYLDIDGSIEFSKRHGIEGVIGFDIKGFPRVKAPAITIGVTQLKGKWILGEYIKNEPICVEHSKRPQEYCNALTTKVSRAIVNIGLGLEKDKKIIDPCCGVGTIVIEALSMGFDIVGADINEKIVRGANRNLDYFDLPEVATVGSIHDITEHYDVVFIDLPYGILSIASRENRLDIVRSAKRIGDKLVLVSVESIEQELQDMGFMIEEHCLIVKANFKRNLYVCKNTY